jgi:hypothetical protein
MIRGNWCVYAVVFFKRTIKLYVFYSTVKRGSKSECSYFYLNIKIAENVKVIELTQLYSKYYN